MLIPVLIRLEQEDKEAIDRLSAKDGAPKSHHYRQAVVLYLKMMDSKPSGSEGKVGITKDL